MFIVSLSWSPALCTLSPSFCLLSRFARLLQHAADTALLVLVANAFTPWFKLIAESFLYQWWDSLLAARSSSAEALDAKRLIPLVEARSVEMGAILRM